MENCRIMVVDDEYLPRQNIINILDWEKFGFSIVGEVTNAMQALELIEEVKPNVILCDIVMPYIDGIELSKIIKKRYPEVEIIILSGYDNFDYVKTAFKYGVTDYILKPTLSGKQLLEILQPIQQKLGQDIGFVELVDEEADLCKTILHMLENDTLNRDIISKNFTDEEYTILSFGITYAYGIDKRLIYEKLKKIYKNFNYIHMDISEEKSIVLFNHKYVDRFKINLRWGDFIRYLEAKDKNIYAIKIDAISTVEDIEVGYRAVKKLARQYFYGFNDMYHNMHLSEVPELIENEIDFSGFMERADSNSPAIALMFLKQYLDSIDSKNSLSVCELKATVQNCVYNIINMIQVSEEYYSEVNTQKINFFNSVSESKTFKELMESYNSINGYLENLIDNMGIADKIMEKVTEYIHQHFCEQMNLQMIANELFISYSYLSTYFNNHHNMCFNDYLNQVRIKKAKEYLKDNTVQISYVSHMVGYSSQGYFAKVFKKTVGMTPTKYRKKFAK